MNFKSGNEYIFFTHPPLIINKKTTSSEIGKRPSVVEVYRAELLNIVEGIFSERDTYRTCACGLLVATVLNTRQGVELKY